MSLIDLFILNLQPHPQKDGKRKYNNCGCGVIGSRTRLRIWR